MMAVIAHNDLDGVVAGYILFNTLMSTNFEEDVSIHFIDYDPTKQQAVLNEVKLHKYTKIYFVDFTPPIEFVTKLNYDKLIIIDHHKTAKATLDQLADMGAKVIYADGAPSASMLTYSYCVGIATSEMIDDLFFEDLLTLATLANDWDLWHRKNPISRKLALMVELLGPRDSFKFIQNRLPEALEEEGSLESVKELEIFEKIGNRQIQESLNIAKSHLKEFYIKWHDKSYLAAIAPCVGYASEVGEKIFTAPQYAERSVILFLYDLNKSSCEIRTSYEDGDLDLGQLAKSLGGGGHKRAAGFVLYEKIQLSALEQKLKESGII